MVGTTGKLASSSDLDRSLTFGDVAGVDDAKSQVQVGQRKTEKSDGDLGKVV